MNGTIEQKKKTYEKHYKKYKLQEFNIVEETIDIYNNVTKKYIDNIPDTHTAWIDEILDGTKEQNNILLDIKKNDDNEDGFVTCVDTKWKVNLTKYKKEEWKDKLNNIDTSLYLLILVRNKNIKSLRDLNGNHLELLEMIYKKNTTMVEQLFGLKKHKLRIFVHYYPQYYRFHIHVASIKVNFGIECGKAILLTDVIQHLKIDSEYYQKYTLYGRLGSKEELFLKIEEYNKLKSESKNDF